MTAKINEPGTNGVGKAFYATTPIIMNIAGNEIIGNTVVGCSTLNGYVTGYINVNVAPVTIKYHTLGGYSSVDCYCDSSLVIQGVGSYNDHQGYQSQNDQFITINNVGTYSFTLVGSGPNCNSCGSWDTRIQLQ